MLTLSPAFMTTSFFLPWCMKRNFPGREALAVALMPPSFQDRLTVRPPRVRSPVAEPSVHESASAGASMMTPVALLLNLALDQALGQAGRHAEVAVDLVGGCMSNRLGLMYFFNCV